MTDAETRRWAVELLEEVTASTAAIVLAANTYAVRVRQWALQRALIRATVLAANTYAGMGGNSADFAAVWAEAHRLVREMGEEGAHEAAHLRTAVSGR